MLDFDLAKIYGVETRTLKQSVRRNFDLFPNDFMFVLTEIEVKNMISQFVIPSKQHLGGSFPYAFTETGVAMLSSVLKSKKAKEINIAIMRAFVELRKVLYTTSELRSEIEKIKQELNNNNKTIEYIFQLLDELADANFKLDSKNKIGFKKRMRCRFN